MVNARLTMFGAARERPRHAARATGRDPSAIHAYVRVNVAEGTPVDKVADALNDRARLDFAIVNLPAFLSVVFGSAACEFRHVAQSQNRTLPTAPVPIALDA